VFDQVKTLLGNFRGDIEHEEVAAHNRCVAEHKWVKNQIRLAVVKLAHRTKDVNDLKAHIAWLENEKHETEEAIKSRENRIKANKLLLEKFKQERCANNLLFVKSLREHIEGIEVMSLLRADIVDYFKKRAKNPWKAPVSFFEKFSEFEHLLDEEHKLILAQLQKKLRSKKVRTLLKKNIWAAQEGRERNVAGLSAKTAAYSAVRDRTKAEVGTAHVDNTRAELKKLATPGYESVALYLTKLEQKVLAMIDSLILHLKNSRDALTKNELKAAEDFAIFQKNMFKENRFLRDKIKSLNVHLVDLKNQLVKSNKQLVRRLKLQKEAEVQLANFRRMKKEKDDYCKKEHQRRVNELANVKAAQTIFESVLNKLSSKVRARTQSKMQGKKYGKGEQFMRKEVVRAEKGTDTGLASRVKERAEVVLTETKGEEDQ